MNKIKILLISTIALIFISLITYFILTSEALEERKIRNEYLQQTENLKREEPFLGPNTNTPLMDLLP